MYDTIASATASRQNQMRLGRAIQSVLHPLYAHNLEDAAAA